MKEAIRHHYIPQFLLSFFCDNEGYTFCYKKDNQTISLANKQKIFMDYNLYRDEVNKSDDPIAIEKDLARFEQDVSFIIRKCNDGKEVRLSETEINKLKLFLAIMPFRSKRASELFGNNISKQAKDFYSQYSGDKSIQDLWRKNLGALANTRSIKEVESNQDIDDPIKLFLRRDAEGLFGNYIVILDSKYPDCFILGDAYPIVITGVFGMGIELPLYSIYPISPTRILLLVSNGIENAPQQARHFSLQLLSKPMVKNNYDIIRARRLYKSDVKRINAVIYKNSSMFIQNVSEKHAELVIRQEVTEFENLLRLNPEPL